ncbi:MAG: Endoglucanase precursor [Gemmatimonadetes bacterium]|jgi:endoglucanase|nr:Endoglucanase precursor [Gemmatimonadota bacterium]
MRFRSFALVVVGVMAAGCSSGPQAIDGPQGGGAVLQPVSTSLSGEAGFALAEPVRVKVVDDKGTPMAGETVTFEVTGGGGSVSPAAATTDSAGIASTQWTLGPTPGTNSLKATRGTSITITANGTDGLGTAILKVSGGTTDSLPAGCAVREPFTVQVVDKAGSPVQGATVNFEVATGDGTVAAPTMKTGPDGMTSTAFRVGFLGGANVVRAVLRTSARPSVEFSARSAPAAPNGFSIIGKTIYDPGTCKPVLFHGAARPALQWWYNADDQWAQFAQQATMLKAWGANVIRIPVSETYWTTGTYWNGEAVKAGVDYKAKVISAVNTARGLGLTVIVDLHSSDRGITNYTDTPDIYKMPDVEHSIPFWRDIATAFKNDGGVIFELYNEPHPREDVWTDGQMDAQAWQLWRNGGVVEAGKDYPCSDCPTLPAYNAAGMQQLYDAIRGVGARNLVLVNGVHWGYSLQGIPQYALAGYNVIYGTHPYDWADKQPDQFDKEFGFLAATYPVMISEFGSYTCAPNPAANTLGPEYNRRVLDYADAKGLSWVAWAFWTPPPEPAVGQTAAQRAEQLCARSALIADWNGTPTTTGQIVKDRLASYR